MRNSDDAHLPRSRSQAKFKVNASLIKNAQASTELKGLNVRTVNQEDMEEGLMAQMDEAIAEQDRQQAVVRLNRELKATRYVWCRWLGYIYSSSSPKQYIGSVRTLLFFIINISPERM